MIASESIDAVKSSKDRISALLVNAGNDAPIALSIIVKGIFFD